MAENINDLRHITMILTYINKLYNYPSNSFLNNYILLLKNTLNKNTLYGYQFMGQMLIPEKELVFDQYKLYFNELINALRKKADIDIINGIIINLAQICRITHNGKSSVATYLEIPIKNNI